MKTLLTIFTLVFTVMFSSTSFAGWTKVSYEAQASTIINRKPINYLITALTKINKPKSLRIAKELKSLKNTDNSYNLIIRRANLNSLDAKIISKAIEKIKKNDGPLLDKISMSFNEDITDDGLGYILQVLPESTSTIAFVECGLTDISGEQIINWAYAHKGIKEIYLEGNLFSKDTINKFVKLKKDKPKISMIIEWPSKEFKKFVLENYK